MPYKTGFKKSKNLEVEIEVPNASAAGQTTLFLNKKDFERKKTRCPAPIKSTILINLVFFCPKALTNWRLPLSKCP